MDLIFWVIAMILFTNLVIVIGAGVAILFAIVQDYINKYYKKKGREMK